VNSLFPFAHSFARPQSALNLAVLISSPHEIIVRKATNSTSNEHLEWTSPFGPFYSSASAYFCNNYFLHSENTFIIAHKMALLEVKYFSHSIAMGCSFKSGAWKVEWSGMSGCEI